MGKSDTTPSNDDPSFEQSLEELETLVERMEDGELTLEDSLATFERGITLARTCQKALEQAEQRIEMLTEQDDAPSPFDPDDNDAA